MDDTFGYLDQQLARYSSKLRDDLRISNDDANRLASAMHRDCIAIGADQLKQALRADRIALSKRKDELLAFQTFMDTIDRAPRPIPPEVVRVQVIAQFYISFVYMRDTMIDSVRRIAPSDSTLKRVCKRLCDGEVRALRNAVAHGNWTYHDDFSGIRYWAAKGEDSNKLQEFVLNQEDLDFWQALARCTGYVIIETACTY